MSNSVDESIRLERYKYVLGQKKDLNERTFRIIAIYQVIVLAVAGSQFEIVDRAVNKKIELALAVDATWILFGIFAFISSATLALLGGGIAAWMSYKRDEEAIDRGISGVRRSSFSIKNCLKWYETYLIATIICGFILYLFVIIRMIVPYLYTLR